MYQRKLLKTADPIRREMMACSHVAFKNRHVDSTKPHVCIDRKKVCGEGASAVFRDVALVSYVAITKHTRSEASFCSSLLLAPLPGRRFLRTISN